MCARGGELFEKLKTDLLSIISFLKKYKLQKVSLKSSKEFEWWNEKVSYFLWPTVELLV